MTKKLFVHHPVFRLLSPIFSGTLVYLLLLLINNNIGQLQDTFLGEELYVCIGLAYLIQEFSRLSLLFFRRWNTPKSLFLKAAVQLLATIAVTVVLVSSSMYLYFKFVLFYTPNMRELFVFNHLFGFITLIYVILYLSHGFLYRINTERIAEELNAKNEIEADFLAFKRGINPDLLYESLEAMLVLMKEDAEAAEQFSEHFSIVYRYILSKGKRELVSLGEELEVLHELVLLLNHLPYRKIEFENKVKSMQWIVPTSLLQLVEYIVKTTISSNHKVLKIKLFEDQEYCSLQYRPEEKLNAQLTKATIKTIRNSYAYYAENKVLLTEENGFRILKLPKIEYDERSDH
ncbi:histidine kinase [uncultured Croceitalea sp.]|uniref:histidine kinase n=1 Tax=uncultured Croceitalea sp. TaxID=1798908 RepID=UPI0033057C4A